MEDATQTIHNKTRSKSVTLLMGLKPKIWIYISSCFTILFNFIFAFAGLISMNHFNLLSFFRLIFLWVWLGGFFFSLLFGICLIFLTIYNKLNIESKNLINFYQILILINIGSLVIAIGYDLAYFWIGLLTNFILDGVLIGLSIILTIFDYIQWLSLKRHFDSIVIVSKKPKLALLIKNDIDEQYRPAGELTGSINSF